MVARCGVVLTARMVMYQRWPTGTRNKPRGWEGNDVAAWAAAGGAVLGAWVQCQRWLVVWRWSVNSRG